MVAAIDEEEEEISGDAMSTLIVNKMRGNLNVLAVRAYTIDGELLEIGGSALDAADTPSAAQLLREQLGQTVHAAHRLDKGTSGVLLFALDPDGTINPDNNVSVPGSEALDSADGIVMALRFRRWPDEAMRRKILVDQPRQVYGFTA